MKFTALIAYNFMSQINKPFAALLLLGSLLLGSGCAFAPQTATLDPEVFVSASKIGEGKTIALRVLDERASEEIGRRGIQMAKISIEQDLALLIEEKLTSGLQQKGFTVVEYDAAADRKLEVELRNLDYKTSMGFWTGGVHITGALKAEAVAGARQYSEFYRTENEKRVIVNPTKEGNEKMINQGLSDLLGELFKDRKLFEFLAN